MHPAVAGSSVATVGPGSLGPPGAAARGAGDRIACWRGGTPRTTRAVSVLAGGAVWLLLGGPVGGALGLVVALVLPVLISRLEPARVRRERLDLIRSAPLVADLLAAALMAGVPLEHAIPVVARAIGGPGRGGPDGRPPPDGAGGADGAGMGGAVADPRPRWRGPGGRPLQPDRGAPGRAAGAVGGGPAPAASAAALAEVRATGVRAVLPLGLCLLPAFALLGIAPIVGGLLPAL